MKKKIFLSLLLFVLIIPCCILAGCGRGEEFKYDFTDADGVHFVLPGSFNAAAGGFESGNGYVKKGESVKYDLILSNVYDASTLKIYNNGEEVSWTKYSSYNSNFEVDEYTYQLVGYVEVENVSQDVNLTATADYRTINFAFKIKEDHSLSEEDKTRLKDWKIDSSSTLYDAISKENFVVSMSYGEYKEKGINLTTNKKFGYYFVSNGDDCFIENGYFDNNWTSEKNSYKLTLNSVLGENNTLSIIPEKLIVNKFIIENQAGNIISISSTEIKDIDLALSEGFGANDTGTIRVTLKEIAGVDFSNVKLVINETNLGSPSTNAATSEKYWEFSTLNCPIVYANFKEGESYFDKSIHDSKYILSVTGLSFSQDSNVGKFIITTESKDPLNSPRIAYFEDFSVYYYDGVNTVYVPTEQPTFRTELFMYDNNKPNCITIVKNGDQENKIVISIADHLQELIEKRNFTVGEINISVSAADGFSSISEIDSYSLTISNEKATFEINYGFSN